MKVVKSSEMAEIEKKAYDAGFSEDDFMEQAGRGIFEYVTEYLEDKGLPKKVFMLLGKGNNAGDAFVAGTYLLEKGIQIDALLMAEPEKCSPLTQKNLKRYQEKSGKVKVYDPKEDFSFPKDGIILDGLFGTGLKSAPREPFASIIEQANKSHLPIISIDIPSGLNGDSGVAEGSVINADTTIYLGLAKLGFFFQDGFNHIGKLHYVDFGLPKQFIDSFEEKFQLIDNTKATQLLPKMKRNRHKFEAGYVVGLAGSKGMPGAANLSCQAALRGGAGYMRLLYPEGMECELSASMYELVKTSYHPDNTDFVIETMNKANSVFIGPGLSSDKPFVNLLKKIFPALETKVVIDATALTIIAENQLALPKNCILTPHLGEMRRLLGDTERKPLNMQFIDLCIEYAAKQKCVLILKGAPTFIIEEGKPTCISIAGDPGMATAGSGDVLTGLISALLAQGLEMSQAAYVGVSIHGLSGEIAAKKLTSYSMTASDITNQFKEIFKHTKEN